MRGDGQSNRSLKPISPLHLFLKATSGYILVLSRMFGYVDQKLLGRSQKKFGLVKSNFYGRNSFYFQCLYSNAQLASSRRLTRQHISGVVILCVFLLAFYW
jgi:hypothetical protein